MPPLRTAAFEVEGRATLLGISPEEKVFRSIWQPSTARAFANLLKTMVGAGVLTLPQAAKNFGVVASNIGLIGAGYFSATAILMLVKCNAKIRGAEGEGGGDGENPAGEGEMGTWQRIARAAYGRFGVALVATAILVAQLGVCAAYFDFVVVTMVDHAGITHTRALALTWVLLTLVSMPRQLKSVALLSVAGLLTYVYVLVLLGMFASEALDCSASANATADGLACAVLAERIHGTSPICHAGLTTQPALFRPRGFGAWFGPAIFAFEGMGTALSIYDAVVDATEQRAPAGTSRAVVRQAADSAFKAVVYSAYSIGVALYIGVGTVGYLGFGEAVPGTVIDAFPHGAARDSAESALAIVLGLTFALQMNPVWGLLEPALLCNDAVKMVWPLLRASVVGLIALACSLIPEVEGMVAISGSVGFSLIGFILPGLFHLQLSSSRHTPLPSSSTAPTGAPQHWWARAKAFARRIPRAFLRERRTGRRPRGYGDHLIAAALVTVGCTGSVLGVAAIFFGAQVAIVIPDC